VKIVRKLVQFFPSEHENKSGQLFLRNRIDEYKIFTGLTIPADLTKISMNADAQSISGS